MINQKRKTPQLPIHDSFLSGDKDAADDDGDGDLVVELFYCLSDQIKKLSRIGSWVVLFLSDQIKNKTTQLATHYSCLPGDTDAADDDGDGELVVELFFLFIWSDQEPIMNW